MLAEPPLVSVVIPTYNRAMLLRQALESVAAQDYRPIEAVVVDDGSEDDTGRVIEEAEGRCAEAGVVLRSRVLVVNSGPSAARNAGLQLASGALVAFLDSDDLWRPRFLSTLVRIMERYPDCGVAFSGHVGIDANERELASRSTDLAAEAGRLRTPFNRLISGRYPFITSGTLVRREVLDAVGPFDDTLPIWQDADLWLRIAKQFDFAYVLDPLACYRIHGGNITHRRLEWFSDQLRVTLRHLGDVDDAATRRVAVEQVQIAQVLLQEELLRRGASIDGYEALLQNEYAPGTARFRLGRLVMRGPCGLRRSYAAAVRGVGHVRRHLPHVTGTAVATARA